MDALFGQQREIKIPHLEKCEVCKGTGSKPGTGPPTRLLVEEWHGKELPEHLLCNFTQVAECPHAMELADNC